jgi:UDP-N-acetylmuramoylalanine--D-glutamate ligase
MKITKKSKALSIILTTWKSLKNYMEQFKGKKITILGLGLLGGALNDAIYLAKHGAKLSITDIKTAEQLKPSIQKLKKYKDIKFVFGGHDMEDFRNADLILQPGNVPVDSPYLVEARKNKIPVFVSESLFAKYAEGVKLVGVTGTRGKSTVTALIYEILSKNLKGKKVYLGGNVKNVSTLALLDKVKKGDVVVLELDSWALHGMGDIKMSPNTSVFTTFYADHLNYYKGDIKTYFLDKANIFKYQRKDDLLVVGKQTLPFIKKWGRRIESKMITGKEILPKGWKFNLPGIHNEYNAMLAVEVARSFSISEIKIKKAIADFKPLSGRLEFIREVRGVKIYNDTNSTTPEATVAALKALDPKSKKNIILIAGGADKGLDLSVARTVVHTHCKKVFFLAGSGTDKIKGPNDLVYNSLKKAVLAAFEVSTKGDILLLSPAFASFGMFKNEFDRGDQFLKIVKKLK